MRFGHSVILTVLALTGMSCGPRVSETRAQEWRGADSIPPEVRALVRAIADGDSAGVAALTIYPLERPYPLQNIENEAAMRRYYPILVDDSLRTTVGLSTPGQWAEFGWRGWSLENGEYVWVDGGLYSVNYMSAREKNLRDSLIEREMATLWEPLRRGWTPEECMEGTETPEIMRIDGRRRPGFDNEYRLCIYGSKKAMREKPGRILNGHMDIEGSAGVHVYHFESPEGLKAVYIPDVMDDTPMTVTLTDADGNEKLIKVRRAYWLTLIPR